MVQSNVYLYLLKWFVTNYHLYHTLFSIVSLPPSYIPIQLMGVVNQVIQYVNFFHANLFSDSL